MGVTATALLKLDLVAQEAIITGKTHVMIFVEMEEV